MGADGDGHLTVDLHADRVVLRLHDLAAGAVTGHELRLAPRVSTALAERGLRTVPGDGLAAPQLLEIAIDALDIPSDPAVLEGGHGLRRRARSSRPG